MDLDRIKKKGKERTGVLVDPRGDEDGGNADAEPVEVEVEGVRADDAVGIGHPGDGRGHVIVEPPVLIVGDEKRRLVPLRARSQRLVDLLDQPLPHSHVVRRVIVVGRKQLRVEVLLLDNGVVRELPEARVALEGGLVGVELAHVLEPAETLEEEYGGDVLVVDAEREPVVVK